MSKSEAPDPSSSSSSSSSDAASRALENEVERKGASRTDLDDRQRAVQRRIMLTLPHVMRFGMRVRELGRRVRRQPHIVEFYHQVDDPYSQLALEAIGPLLDLYDIECRFSLVSQTDLEHAPEPKLLSEYAARDCALVAADYHLPFDFSLNRPLDPPLDRPLTPASPNAEGAPDHGPELPSRKDIEYVEGMLAGLVGDPRFRDVALEAGRALWANNQDALRKIQARTPAASPSETKNVLAQGNARRTRKRHYSGGMFWYAGEWFWGVDRLHHLERRLIALGAARDGQTMPRFDRPAIDPGTHQNEGRLRLEFYPSLRSPYTAMIFDRTIAMAASVDVPITIRPVLPMVMRGVPAPFAKGIYIMTDAKREADHIGVPFGDMFDPIGRPVERGFSLWPFARDQGKGPEFLSAFLRAAFAEGRNTGSDEGIRALVEEAGLSYEEARVHLDGDDWREEIEENRRVMYHKLGLWGVPSYRLMTVKNSGDSGDSGASPEPDFSVWGQDRLWRVAAEIRRRLA